MTLHRVRHAGIVVVLHIHDITGPLLLVELGVVYDDLALGHRCGSAHGDALKGHQPVRAGLTGRDIVRVPGGGAEHMVPIYHVADL